MKNIPTIEREVYHLMKRPDGYISNQSALWLINLILETTADSCLSHGIIIDPERERVNDDSVSVHFPEGVNYG